jgi:hypothetical protein
MARVPRSSYLLLKARIRHTTPPRSGIEASSVEPAKSAKIIGGFTLARVNAKRKMAKMTPETPKKR